MPFDWVSSFVAGENIRRLEKKRRFKSSCFLATATVSAVIFIWCLSRIINSPEIGALSLDNLFFKGFFLFSLFGLASAGMHFRQAGYAQMGAETEEVLFEILESFCEENGWSIKTNAEFPELGGDIDFVLLSPTKKIICIDAKTNFSDYYLDTHVRSGIRQAMRLKEHLKTFEWVDSVICYRNGLGDLSPMSHFRKRRGFVTSFESVLDVLRQIERS